MDVETYKQDEKQMFLNHTLTATNDEYATKYLQGFLSGNMVESMAFLKAINEYGETCLDVGSSYGAQYFGLKKFYPNIKWTGCEISQQYIDRFKNLLEEGENAEVFLISDYKDLSSIPDNSYDVVTSRSMLCHYTPENAFKIIDEMLRIAKKAVVIKFYCLPTDNDDRYVEGFGNMTDRGYFVYWSKLKWDEYIKDKKVKEYEKKEVIVIEK